MKKNGFTMIELVFVIVILGILAAVAIPKLSATRDDAQVSRDASAIMTGCADIAAYAMSNAKTEDNITQMSRVLETMVANGQASLDMANKKIVVKEGNVNDCVTISVLTSATDDNLTISFGNAGADSMCKQLQSAIDATQYPMKLRGTNVTYK